MHDFLLAKKIMEVIRKYTKENHLKSVSQINLEIGKIREHSEDLKINNLKFNLKLLGKGFLTKKVKIKIKRIKKDSWRLTGITGEKN